MNNPNPFVPKGSILEQQSKRRSRLKVAVYCVLAVSIIGLAAILPACKREPADTTDTSTTTIDTNTTPIVDTNTQPVDTNPVVATPPVVTNVQPVAIPQTTEPSGTEYVVVQHDTLGKIAKKNGVTLKDLETANPLVIPTKLRIGQKLTIPAGGSGVSSSMAPVTDSTGTSTGGEVYVVKSGDNLTKIARRYGITVRAIKSENSLTTDHIKVGQKLKIPSKTDVVLPAEAGAEPGLAPVTSAPVVNSMTPGTTSAK
jgi:peptidoglycan endopeptidase LytE